MEKVREAGYVAHPVSCPSSCPALVVCEILALGEDSSPKAEQKVLQKEASPAHRRLTVKNRRQFT